MLGVRLVWVDCFLLTRVSIRPQNWLIDMPNVGECMAGGVGLICLFDNWFKR